MKRLHHIRLLALAAMLIGAATLHGQEWKTLLDLKGTWKIELGDNFQWAIPGFNDARWDNIEVPAPWEDEGFPGYDGYAWYRKHFKVDKGLKDRVVYLRVGSVDDVSEVYLNGHMIGFQGEFPPHFNTAYNVPGQYPVPPQYLNYTGDNVVAVRVFDQMQEGGITHGPVGLFEPRNYLYPDYNLAGVWKFTTGDDESWKDPSTNDSKWTSVIVPAYWEGQGFKDYDGFGWYRLKFRVPDNMIGQRLILLVGKVDDVDETYVNGELIGKTGRMRKNMTRNDVSDEWTRLRAYVMPSDLLLSGRDNVIAVRVNDVYLHGGIYDGPIGLVTRDRYLKWKRENETEPWNIFDWFR